MQEAVVATAAGRPRRLFVAMHARLEMLEQSRLREPCSMAKSGWICASIGDNTAVHFLGKKISPDGRPISDRTNSQPDPLASRTEKITSTVTVRKHRARNSAGPRYTRNSVKIAQDEKTRWQ
jgi:hypothetical protein